MSLVGRVRSFLHRIGIDPAVRNTLLGRGWFAFSGLISMFLLAHFLTRSEQGYYFAFSSVVGLQVFFELGLSSVILQFASHERAHLSVNSDGTLSGDPNHKSRLASLLRSSLLWYLVCAVLLVVLLLPGGYAFFVTNSKHNVGINWRLPWCWIVIMTGGWLAITPMLALIEGCGFVREIAGLQLRYSLVGSLLFWLALVAHWHLYTAPITNTVSLVYGMAWIWKKYKVMLLDLLRTPINHVSGVIGWRAEVWPLQWKIAASWGSGYLVFSTFTPILFAERGSVAAGRMGLSLTVMSAISALALAWVSTKAAPFGSLVAVRNWKELDRIFFPSMLYSSLALALLGALVFLGTVLLDVAHVALAARVLPPIPLLLLILTTLINQPLFAAAIYLRAHKQEPFIWLSVLNGIAVTTCTLVVARHFGATGIMAGYLVINTMSTTYGLWLFYTLRRRWHEGPAVAVTALETGKDVVNG